jgi:hypothetical protein
MNGSPEEAGREHRSRSSVDRLIAAQAHRDPELRRLARKHTSAAIQKPVRIMETGDSEQACIAAANSILDRGWGKPTQPIAGDDDAPPVMVVDARTTLLDAFARIVDAGTKRGGGGEPDAGTGRGDPS